MLLLQVTKFKFSFRHIGVAWHVTSIRPTNTHGAYMMGEKDRRLPPKAQKNVLFFGRVVMENIYL